ncbi:hypothetical protein RIR_jg13354.t1 [Rhizophagus irregularis DAOM 181602=DAOM 197198]|nr:hypothetical protein RIR_jg13354.t1 [Rhizophagus irregularis DAOM 181602=DAOM 197198]
MDNAQAFKSDNKTNNKKTFDIIDIVQEIAFKPELLFGECEFKLRNIFTVLSSYMTALIRRLFLTLYQSEL